MDRPNDPIAEQFMSVPQVAKTLRVAEAKIRNWIDDGELSAVDVSNGKQVPRWRIRRADLHAFLSRRSRQNQDI